MNQQRPLGNEDRKTGPMMPLASIRHTIIFLLILAVVSIVAGPRATRAPATTNGTPAHLATYMILIGIQLLWLRYIRVGMNRNGHRISEFLDFDSIRPTAALIDLAYAVMTFAIMKGFLIAMNHLFGGIDARTAFLLPQGGAESILWIFLSLVAGFCEEVAFRGYLQRQLTAVLGNVAGAVVLQAIVFGISHGYQGWRATTVASGYGVIFGGLAWWRGQLRPGVLTHAAIDITAGLHLL